MRSLLAGEPMRQALRESGERSQGLLPQFLSFAAGRATTTNIANMRALPVLANTQEMQDADGNFYFIEGYSQVGGPDVPRP